MRKILAVCMVALCLASCNGEQVETTEDAYPSVTVPTAPVTEATEAPPEPELFSLSFVGVGDNIVYYGNVRDAAKNAKGTELKYDFRPSYSDIKPVVEAYDLAFINQETLMCGEGYELSYYPYFNSPQELGDAVVDSGFDIIGLSNNHMLDKGEKGLLKTLDYWEEKEVVPIGAYRSRQDYEDITVIEKNGISIALLSFTYSTNGNKLPSTSEVYIPYFCHFEKNAETDISYAVVHKEELAEMVKRAEELADITLVSIHWGNENNFKPATYQREAAEIIAENGGDIIIGHHPHVIQPVEWIETEMGKTLCVYSLGNFMAEMAKDYNMVGGMISFDIEKLGEDGKAEVKNVLFTPTMFDFNKSFYNNHVYFLEDYTDEQAKAHGISYYGNYTTLETLKDYVTNTIDEEFLPEYFK